jgi:hypothetical protein
MKKISISVTEAARNFAGCINRVQHQDVTFVLPGVAPRLPRLRRTMTRSAMGVNLQRF